MKVFKTAHTLSELPLYHWTKLDKFVDDKRDAEENLQTSEHSKSQIERQKQNT